MRCDNREIGAGQVVLLWVLCAVLAVSGLTECHGSQPDRTWTVYIAQDKHLDYNWCGTTTEIELRMTALLDYYIEQAERKSGRWNLDGTLWADVYRRHRGREGLTRLHHAIAAGDIGFGGNHCVLLWGILDTETAIRACYGAARVERATGQPARTALVMENYGMTWGIANVLSECAFDYVGRGIYPLRAESYIRDRDPYPLFWWRAPNGKRLLVRWDLYDDTKSWGGYAEAFRLAELAGVQPMAQRLQRIEDRNTPEVFEKRKAYIRQTVARYEAYGADYPISSILLLGTGHDGWVCTDDISRFIERFNAETDGRVRVVDARYQDFFEAAAAEIRQKGLTLPSLEGSFGICWEEWAAHLAGLTKDFREAERLLRLAEASHAVKAIRDESVLGSSDARIELINHGFERLLGFAEHDMGGMSRRFAAISAGVRADAVTQALDIGRALAPAFPKASRPSADQLRPENLEFPWNGGRVVFDKQRCAIASISDADGRELVPQGNGLAFGEFIHTRYKTRAKKPSVFPDPIEWPSEFLLRRLACWRAPGCVEVLAEFDRRGYAVTSTWLFHADRPWIDITYRLEDGWTDDPQTVQFAFPLAMHDPIYHYDVPGAVLIAGAKAEGGDDLPGANPDLFAGLTFAAATSEGRNVLLLTPDTLLLEFGPKAVRAPGYKIDGVPAQITSMPMMNLTRNDWQFGQAGQRDWTFRYRIVLSDGSWDPLRPFVEAQQFGTSPFLHVSGTDPAVPGFELLEIDFAGGPVLAFKIAEDRRRFVLRVWNVRRERCAGSLKLPEGFARAEACDALERPKRSLEVSEGRVHFSADARAILTIALCGE